MNQPQTVLQALGGLGVTELILILLIVLLVFGAGKLPQIGDALGRGHGLGLAIARRAAERHGGQLQLGNHPGGGFIASLRLPLA